MTMTLDTLDRWAYEICPGHPIDRGIVVAVKLLLDAGFETFEACEGGGDHAYAEPTVRFEGGEADGRPALDLLHAAGLPIRRLSRTWAYHHGELEESPFWEITFRERLDQYETFGHSSQ